MAEFPILRDRDSRLTHGSSSASVSLVSNVKAQPDQDRTSSIGVVFKRIVEWFWRRGALAEQGRVEPELDPRAKVLALRASASADIARLAIMPAEPLAAPGEAIACELYRQSAYWSAAALSFASQAEMGLGSDEEPVWRTLDESLLARAGEDEKRIDALRSRIRQGSFRYFAELSREEQLASSSELRRLAEALLAKLADRSRGSRAIYRQRAWRLGLLLVLMLGVIRGALAVREAREQRSDLLAGKAWRVSSHYDAGGCSSPEQQCPENGGYFFHTAEDSRPWVEFDLGRPVSFATVQVENRRDCCAERAVPLAVEVSSDRKNWRTVARRDAEFSVWRASFPTVEAHWLRLHLLKKGYLHLSRVRAFP